MKGTPLIRLAKAEAAIVEAAKNRQQIMLTLMNARLLGCDASRVEIALDRGFRLTIFFLDTHLARLLITRPGGLRMSRTWSLSPELRPGDDPIDGRDRYDLTGFPGTPICSIPESETAITIETALIGAEIRRGPSANNVEVPLSAG